MKNCVTDNHSVARFKVNQNLRPTKDHKAESISAQALEQSARPQVKKCEWQILLLTANAATLWRQVTGAHRVRQTSYQCTKRDRKRALNRPAAGATFCQASLSLFCQVGPSILVFPKWAFRASLALLIIDTLLMWAPNYRIRHHNVCYSVTLDKFDDFLNR